MTPSMLVHSVNIGRPQIVLAPGRQYSSAIGRRPVPGPVELTTIGFAGDRVSDEKVHGGPDMAACCYPLEHYAWWNERLGRELAIPSFGENLTTSGLLETEVCIGDTYRIGTATVQVSQPRGPCFKLAHQLGAAEAISWIHENGFSGFYLRVIESGVIRPGDEIQAISRPNPDFPVRLLLRLKHDKAAAAPHAARLTRIPELSGRWRDFFADVSTGAA